MSRAPDFFIGRLFVPAEKHEEVIVALAREKLWVNTEAPKAVTFRGGGPHGFLVEGKNLLVMGDERAFGQLAEMLTTLDLTRYNPELFCEETRERRTTDLPFPLPRASRSPGPGPAGPGPGELLIEKQLFRHIQRFFFKIQVVVLDE